MNFLVTKVDRLELRFEKGTTSIEKIIVSGVLMILECRNSGSTTSSISSTSV
jgi:hypothetical protein